MVPLTEYFGDPQGRWLDCDRDARPYLGLQWRPDGVLVHGQAECSLGRCLGSDEGDEGVFLKWRWDGQRLTVRNDRFGVYPLFYSAVGDEIWLSPSLAAVLRGNSARRPNAAALAVLHRLGHFLGEDTPFEDVHFLPPGATLVWEAGRLDLQSRGIAPRLVQELPSDFDGAIARYGALFAAAVSKRLPHAEVFTVPLSGGRDSRHILLELVRQGARPQACLTVKYRPPATNEDARIAGLLCGRLGLTHRVIDKPASFFQAVRKDIQLTSYCGGGHGWSMPLAAELARTASLSYDGLAGDILSAGHMQDVRKAQLFQANQLRELAVLLLSETRHEAVLAKVLPASVLAEQNFELAVARMIDELERHKQQPNPLRSYLFWNRTRRCIASIPYAIQSSVATVHCPYLDHRLFDFLMGLPLEWTQGGRLHDATIKASYPECADVPYEDKTLVATLTTADCRYYDGARREFARYLMAGLGRHRRALRLGFLLPKLLQELLGHQSGSPWYLFIAVYAAELHALAASARPPDSAR